MRGRALLAPFFVALALLFAAGPALAWGKQAHRIVADLAAHELSPQARAQVQVLLAGEPEPTLPGIANWADELRENDAVRGKATAPWHYLNFPRGGQCAFDAPRDCPDGQCVVAVIEAQRAILADAGKPLAERREALKFLVHFVADVHQPLHAAFADDLGGNRHQLHYADEGTNLHAVWDRLIVRQRDLEPPEYADFLRAQPPSGRCALAREPLSAAAWAQESCRLASAPDFYPPTGKLAPEYLRRQQPVAEQRMREAGQRLARVLEAALVPADTSTAKRGCTP